MLNKSRDELILLRNKILDNPFKKYFPKFKRELAKINYYLDQLDKELYLVERKISITQYECEEEIREILSKSSKESLTDDEKDRLKKLLSSWIK